MQQRSSSLLSHCDRKGVKRDHAVLRKVASDKRALGGGTTVLLRGCTCDTGKSQKMGLWFRSRPMQSQEKSEMQV
ncbi:hypothetical protein HBI56_125580 [Parastagonospora nodorum]|nr:hypothetical protein HBH56_166920 [Parastagonospora nodorum]KAH3936212.1 hypothetical protein HBH54_030000 [Parastagonospora nodorum]KAH3948242.1 hypothetical protein HBH53_104810 [Parastagonospora nodorum]KAH3968599.1 hypothetical protein HBH51_128710 [Parastagonospora nodorum]KAH4026194.1 hypothetical protein HBI09_149790 [Parastagonospora nodorum]